ncbi:hypothetical protein [Bacteroides acidifaciens]|uniref:hypothetical protein n=1 Tax=Bacteroides acidifaciens TaxID=85831 RepID=UPI0030157728
MRRRIELGAGNRLYNRAQSASVPYRHSAVYRRHPGLPVCHETKGRGSLIPRPTSVGGRGVLTSSKLGHGGLSATT